MAVKLLADLQAVVYDDPRIRCSPRCCRDGAAATCRAADLPKPELHGHSDGHAKYELWNRSRESGSEGCLSRQFYQHEFWPCARRREIRQVRRGGEREGNRCLAEEQERRKGPLRLLADGQSD